MCKTMKSVRLTDMTLAMIEEQPGKTFTEKFESFVYEYAQKKSMRERELERLDKEIRQRKTELAILRQTLRQVNNMIDDVLVKNVGCMYEVRL